MAVDFNFRQRRDQFGNPLAIQSNFWGQNQPSPNANAGLIQQLRQNMGAMGTPTWGGSYQGTGSATGSAPNWWGTVVARPNDPAVQEYMQYSNAPIERANAEAYRRVANAGNVRGQSLTGQGGQAALFQQMMKQNAAGYGNSFGDAMNYNKYLAGVMNAGGARALQYYNSLISTLAGLGRDVNQRQDAYQGRLGDEYRFNLEQQLRLPELESAARERMRRERDQRTARDTAYGNDQMWRSATLGGGNPYQAQIPWWQAVAAYSGGPTNSLMRPGTVR